MRSEYQPEIHFERIGGLRGLLANREHAEEGAEDRTYPGEARSNRRRSQHAHGESAKIVGQAGTCREGRTGSSAVKTQQRTECDFARSLAGGGTGPSAGQGGVLPAEIGHNLEFVMRLYHEDAKLKVVLIARV